MIGIVNYGCGNFGSIQNMLDYIGFDSEIVTIPDHLSRYNVLFLPGVGSFDRAMERIHQLGFKAVLDEHAIVQKKPILGVISFIVNCQT